MNVVVIGATGNVGVSVLAALAADPVVDHITGVARRVPTARIDKVTWACADVSSEPLDLVAGADAVVHLAWKIQPQHDHAELFATNVTGTRRVIDAVVRHRVPRLVCASSIGAYAPAAKDRRVDESWPATGIPTSAYSRHKAMVERMLDELELADIDLDVVRMRTSLVFQHHAASEVRRLFLGPLAPHRLPRFARLVPRFDRLAIQATHADDVGEAYRLAVVSDVAGPFNIAAEPVLDADVIADVAQARTVPVPATALRAAAALTWRLHIQPTEQGWVDLVVQSPLMSTVRAQRVLGWAPLTSSTEALRELLRGIADRAGYPTPPLHPDRCGPLASWAQRRTRSLAEARP